MTEFVLTIFHMPSQNSVQVNKQNPEADRFNSWVELAKRSGMSSDDIAQMQAQQNAIMQNKAQEMLPAEAAQAQIQAELPQAPTAPELVQGLSPADTQLVKEQGARVLLKQKLDALDNEKSARKQNISDAFGGLRK